MFSRYSVENIFALRDLKNACRVTYNSAKQDSFVENMDKKQVKFNVMTRYVYV